MVLHACNLSAWRAKMELWLSWTQGYPGLYSELKASPSYKVRHFFHIYIYTPKWEALLALMFMHIFFLLSEQAKPAAPAPCMLSSMRSREASSPFYRTVDRGKRTGRRERQSPSSPLSCPRNRWLPWATEDGVIGFYRKPGVANWKKMMEHYNYVLRLARSAEFVLHHRV